MQLITKELAKKIPLIWKQEALKKEAICYLHYFYGSRDWYVLEYDWENEFFGIVIWEDIEYWPFYLSEFKDINKRAWYPRIERDMYWNKCEVWQIEKLKDFLSSMRDENED